MLSQYPALKLLPTVTLHPAADLQKLAEARSGGKILDHTMMQRPCPILASRRDTEMIMMMPNHRAAPRDVTETEIGREKGTGIDMTTTSLHVGLSQ